MQGTIPCGKHLKDALALLLQDGEKGYVRDAPPGVGCAAPLSFFPFLPAILLSKAKIAHVPVHKVNAVR